MAVRASLLLGLAWCAAATTNARAPFGAVVAADLDGDQQADFATAGAIRADGAGYLLDISVRLSGVESGIITVRTPRAAGRISARDLDGDADRDLILESFDREPLAVVLNDGGGHFHQVSLDHFRALRHRRAPHSLEAPAREGDSLETGESTASAADVPMPAALRSAEARSEDRRPDGDAVTSPEYSTRSSRAPPIVL